MSTPVYFSDDMVVSVREFGATGSSTVDDRPAIAAAIQYAIQGVSPAEDPSHPKKDAEDQ